MEENRRTGQTTRLVDKYIQDIFTKPNEIHYIRDHYSTTDSRGYDDRIVHRHIFNRVMMRLQVEHRIETKKEFGFSSNLVGKLYIDEGNLSIELKVFIRDTSDDGDIIKTMNVLR